MYQQRFIVVSERHIRQQDSVSAKPQKELSALKKLFRYQIQYDPKAHYYLNSHSTYYQRNVNFHLQAAPSEPQLLFTTNVVHFGGSLWILHFCSW